MNELNKKMDCNLEQIDRQFIVYKNFSYILSAFSPSHSFEIQLTSFTLHSYNYLHFFRLPVACYAPG